MRTRRWFPQNGRPYELFDTATLLVILVGLGYLANASTAAAIALDDIIPVVPIWAVGLVPFLAGLSAMALSYTRWVEFGYALAIGGCCFVIALYTVSMISEFDLRVFTQTFVYLWMARRLLREEIYDEQVFRGRA